MSFAINVLQARVQISKLYYNIKDIIFVRSVDYVAMHIPSEWFMLFFFFVYIQSVIAACAFCNHVWYLQKETKQNKKAESFWHRQKLLSMLVVLCVRLVSFF